MAQNQSIFDRLRAMQTEGLPLHTLIVEACEVGNELIVALEKAVSKLRVASIAAGNDPEFVDIMLEPLKAALARAYESNGDTPTNGVRAA